MSRRRLMMLQQSKPDLLEGYRLSHRAYKIESVWQDSNTLTLKHTSAGFMGPNTAAIAYIGDKPVSSTGTAAVFSGLKTVLSTLDSSKKYRLTLTVLNVNSNTAVDETSGSLWFSLGIFNNYVITEIKTCNIVKGTQIILESNNIAGAVVSADNPNLLWSFDFDVRIEEV